MKLRIVPVTLAEANAYVERYHRHNGQLPSSKFACAAIDDAGLVRGVVVAGLPKARMLMSRTTIEVNRVCADGTRDACSQLYAAVVRAGKALGYRRFVTYTVESEDGASLKASGWTKTLDSGGGSWAREARPVVSDAHDLGKKTRWEIVLGDSIDAVTWPHIEPEIQAQLSMVYDDKEAP